MIIGHRIGMALAASLAVTAIAGCAAVPPSARELPPGQVREYQGQRLDPISGFRENSIKGPQKVDIGSYRLEIGGLVQEPSSYRYRDVISRETTYTKVVRLDCVEGWGVTILWEGVLLSDLIDRAGPDSRAVTVVFRCADGYTTSLPLEYVRGRRILLAYKMNGVTIPEERGFPFMVVAEDRWGYKWAKWVTGIELSADPEYEGYWERRGYSRRGLRSNGPFAP